MRNGKKVRVWDWTLVLETRDDEWFVLVDHVGEPVARQRKQDAGRRYQQAGTNPDYDGFLVYPLEVYREGAWSSYNDCARKGDLLSPTFVERLAEANKHKRPAHLTEDEVFAM